MVAEVKRYNLDDLEDFEKLAGQAPHTEDGKPQVIPRRWLYGSPEAEVAGFRTGMDYPDMLPDKKDWKEIIEDCHRQKRFPMYWRRDSGLPQKPTQNGLGHCWNYGATHAFEDRHLFQFGIKKAIKLAPNSLAWLVNWKNQGYYLPETIQGIMSKGIAEASYCKEYELNPRNFKEGWEDNALKHRLAKDGVWDTTRREGLEKMAAMCLALLAGGNSLYIAYNWWGHALEITSLWWDESVFLNLIWGPFNSHADGEIQLTGERAVPNEAYGFGELAFSA